MSTTEVKKLVQKYAKALYDERFPFEAIYVFGSHVHGTAHRWSDIDVAVVSNRFKNDRDEDRLLLWQVRRAIDTRIEPHGFTVEDFKNDADPIVYEIRRTGIRVV